MDNVIDAIIDAMHSVEDVIKGIEPSDNLASSQMLSENIDAHLGIDDICNLLGGGDKGYDTLNKILWSLQEQGVIDFNEDALDRLYNSPNY